MTDFGRDISCTTSLRTGRYATSARLVAEALYRRLTTPRGTLRGGDEEESYGFDLTELVGNNTDVVALPGRISAEAHKDPRIDTIEVDIVESTVAAARSLAITIEATTAEGPFTLQIGIDDVSVALLGLSTEDA